MGLMSSFLFWRRKSPIVPVVRLSGVIAARQSLERRGLSLEAVEPQLKRAFSLKQAKAVVLLINSPGGSPVQSALIGNRIRQLAAQANIPVMPAWAERSRISDRSSPNCEFCRFAQMSIIMNSGRRYVLLSLRYLLECRVVGCRHR